MKRRSDEGVRKEEEAQYSPPMKLSDVSVAEVSQCTCEGFRPQRRTDSSFLP